MESFVTRREFENALKEMRRLHLFLADTFGSKFMEFFNEDKLEETESRLKNQLGEGFTTKLFNASLSGDPPPSSSIVGVNEKTTTRNELIKPKPPASTSPGSPPSLVPIIINTTSVRAPPPPPIDDPLALGTGVDVIPVVSLSSPQKKRNVRKVNPELDSNRPTTPVILPISILPTKPTLPPTSLELQKTTPQPASLTITECITLDDDDGGEEMKISPSPKKQNNSLFPKSSHSNSSSPSSSSRGMQLRGGSLFRAWPSSPPSPPKRRAVSTDSGDTEKLVLTPRITRSHPKPATSDCDEIIQCDDCHLFIYSSQMVDHLKNHEVLGGGGGATKPKRLSANTNASSSTCIFDQNFTCPLCDKECLSYQSYENHCSEAHKEENPCPICKKVLSSKNTLKRHMTGHENRTFVCNVCGKGYNRRDNLVAHAKIHKEENGAPCPFYCTFCKCAFASKDGRDKHMNALHMGNNNSINGEDGSMSSSGDLSRDQLIVPNDDDDHDMIVTDDIDIGPEFKVNVDYLRNGSAFQFEYEGDEEEEEM